jgi:hypothetical protein
MQMPFHHIKETNANSDYINPSINYSMGDYFGKNQK